MKTIEMEITLAHYFNLRQNLIVPNVYWGMGFRHELDLLVLTQANYGYEIEIKISKKDLIQDTQKRHNHESNKIKYLYFAIPEKLESDIEHIPGRAGIIIVRDNFKPWQRGKCKLLRKPVKNSDYKFTEIERLKLYRLMALRIWGLKEKINRYQPTILPETNEDLKF